MVPIWNCPTEYLVEFLTCMIHKQIMKIFWKKETDNETLHIGQWFFLLFAKSLESVSTWSIFFFLIFFAQSPLAIIFQSSHYLPSRRRIYFHLYCLHCCPTVLFVLILHMKYIIINLEYGLFFIVKICGCLFGKIVVVCECSQQDDNIKVGSFRGARRVSQVEFYSVQALPIKKYLSLTNLSWIWSSLIHIYRCYFFE